MIAIESYMEKHTHSNRSRSYYHSLHRHKKAKLNLHVNCKHQPSPSPLPLKYNSWISYVCTQTQCAALILQFFTYGFCITHVSTHTPVLTLYLYLSLHLSLYLSLSLSLSLSHTTSSTQLQNTQYIVFYLSPSRFLSIPKTLCQTYSFFLYTQKVCTCIADKPLKLVCTLNPCTQTLRRIYSHVWHTRSTHVWLSAHIKQLPHVHSASMQVHFMCINNQLNMCMYVHTCKCI